MSEAPHRAVEFILKTAPLFAKAKSDRVQLEEFRKSKKAMLMQQASLSGVQALAAQERDAYASQEYQALLKGLAAAVEQEETLKWQLTAAQLKIEVWRSENANNRFVDRVTT
jgi:hypothetical protein